MVWESGNEAFAAFSLAGLAIVMSLFFCTGTGKEPMRQAFGGWAAIDGCFEARDTQKMGGWHGAFPQIPRPAARPGVSLLMSIAWR